MPLRCHLRATRQQQTCFSWRSPCKAVLGLVPNGAADPSAGQSRKYGSMGETPDSSGDGSDLESPVLSSPDKTPSEGDQAGKDRDRIAVDRDERPEAHDQESEARDERAEARDERAETREFNAVESDAGAIADRAGARRDRRGGASDRTQAADDRKAAVDDREAASADRERSADELAASSIDELTGTHRRDAGAVALEREVAKAKRSKTSLAVAFVDVDGLKEKNDSEGHAAGDHCSATWLTPSGPISAPTT